MPRAATCLKENPPPTEAGLLKEMVNISWNTYFEWELVHVTKQEKQPAVEDELAKSRKTNKEMDDILTALQQEFH
jgi:hypothetical protein